MTLRKRRHGKCGRQHQLRPDDLLDGDCQCFLFHFPFLSNAFQAFAICASLLIERLERPKKIGVVENGDVATVIAAAGAPLQCSLSSGLRVCEHFNGLSSGLRMREHFESLGRGARMHKARTCSGLTPNRLHQSGSNPRVSLTSDDRNSASENGAGRPMAANTSAWKRMQCAGRTAPNSCPHSLHIFASAFENWAT